LNERLVDEIERLEKTAESGSSFPGCQVEMQPFTGLEKRYPQAFCHLDVPNSHSAQDKPLTSEATR
jgi:hypothetical protein